MVGLTERILENCDYLREKHNVSKSELEKSCGVGLGYFSRLRKLKGTVGKSGKEAQVGLPVILKISEYFNISVNALVYMPLKQLDGTQAYLVNFLDKLSTRTREEKTTWECAAEPEFSYPRLRKAKSDEVPVFKSKAYGEKTSIAGSCYTVALPNNVMAYLVKVCNGKSTNESTIEMWFLTNEKRDYICGTADNPAISHMLESLYSEVNLIMNRPQISDELRNAIDDFMKS